MKEIDKTKDIEFMRGKCRLFLFEVLGITCAIEAMVIVLLLLCKASIITASPDKLAVLYGAGILSIPVGGLGCYAAIDKKNKIDRYLVNVEPILATSCQFIETVHSGRGITSSTEAVREVVFGDTKYTIHTNPNLKDYELLNLRLYTSEHTKTKEVIFDTADGKTHKANSVQIC